MTITNYYDPYVSNNYLQNIQAGKAIPYVMILYNQNSSEEVNNILSRFLAANNKELQNGYIYPVMNDYVCGMPIIVFFGQIYHQIKEMSELGDFLTLLDYKPRIQHTTYHKEYTAPIKENLASGQFRIPEQITQTWGF